MTRRDTETLPAAVASPRPRVAEDPRSPTPVEVADRIVRSFGSFKTLPEVALRAAEVSGDPRCSLADLEEVLCRDPTLVSRLLQLVNGPFYGLASEVKSIPQALLVLGLKQLRALVLVDVAAELVCARDGFAVSGRALWLHCTAVGVFAQMVSRRILGVPGDDLFLCGMLHDIGLVLLDQARGEAVGRAFEAHRAGAGSTCECERAVLGTDHVHVGVRLAEQWCFPLVVRHTILHHHDTERYGAGASLEPADLLVVAHHFAGELGYPELPGHGVEPPDWVLAHVAEHELEYQALADDFVDEMKRADRFFQRAPRSSRRAPAGDR